MVLTYDVGSVPFMGDANRFDKGSRMHPFLGLLHYPESSADRKYFEDRIIDGFVDKIRTEISVPNYPQFRDMNTMFLDSMGGIAKTRDGYRVVNRISLRDEKSRIPEVHAIHDRAREIHGTIGHSFELKICVTGPYTLASRFVDRDSRLFVELGRAISKFIAGNAFKDKFGTVTLVAVDEPVFGLVDDPLLDYGREGREELLKAWEIVFHEIKSRDLLSIIHLHNTADELYWQVKSLDIIESHVDDPLYSSSKTLSRLEKGDKLLKASICKTNFDALIRKVEASRGITEAELSQRVAETWTNVRKGSIDPQIFLENMDVISDRLRRIVRQYGKRISFAGPECGLHSFPSYDTALECLRRAAQVAQRLELP